MKYTLMFLALMAFLGACKPTGEEVAQPEVQGTLDEKNIYSNKELSLPVLVIHGGAGSITKDRFNDKLEEAYRNALDSAVTIGYEILMAGGSSIECVEKTINFLEDHPLFNSGKGAVLTAEGNVELDASIMDGSNLMAGAVAGVTNVKNPISLAQLVKDSTKHVLLKGRGAEAFAAKMNFQSVETEYFITPKTRALREERLSRMDKMGTVGCVAMDKAGNIAAGTSTGGMDNKQYGRIGDSPIIGAGTYANNLTCGVSCTGHGEYFIKNAVAYDMSARVEYKGESVKDAASFIIGEKLLSQQARGGLIAIDHNGEIAIEFNTMGMFWASQRAGELAKVGMFLDEKP